MHWIQLVLLVEQLVFLVEQMVIFNLSTGNWQLATGEIMLQLVHLCATGEQLATGEIEIHPCLLSILDVKKGKKRNTIKTNSAKLNTYAGFSEFRNSFFCVWWSSLNIILKKFLKFGKSNLDDSYKKDSYKKSV